VDECGDPDVIRRSLVEPAAFAAVYDRHAAVLFRFLVRRVGRKEADDLLADTFRIAFERRSTFDPSYPSVRPWLYGIATNLVARHRRAEGRRLHALERLAAAAAGEVEDDSVTGSIDAQRGWPAVARAIAGLPEGERDVLLLFVWEDLGYDEIARALDLPIGTVRSRLNRARRRLREARIVP
jgi:RNA polymerase sigma-70 factor (ECF subfamily)